MDRSRQKVGFKMKILFISICLPFFLFAQHFSESFNDFTPSDTVGVLFYANFNSSENNILTDQSSHNITLSAGNNGALASGWFNSEQVISADSVDNPFYSGGKALRFTRADTNFVYALNNGHLATSNNNFTIIYAYKTYTPGSRRHGVFFGNNLTANQGIWLYQGAGNLREADLTGNAGPNGTLLTANTWEVTALTNISGVFQLYSFGTANGSSTSESPNVTTGDIGIGFVYGFPVANVWFFDGAIAWVKIYDSALSIKKIKDLSYLADGWVSKHGEITRNNFAFSQGINGSGLKVKAGSGDYVSQSLTGSSVTYSINLGAVNLASDSIFIATNTDTLSHALADSTLPDGYQWVLSIDGQETGGVVYVDNLILTTAAIASESILQHPEWDGWPEW